MYKIVRKKVFNPTETLMEIEAPLIAKKAQPGQFVILRATADAERIPLTVGGTDLKKGTVTIIFQIVGASTYLLNQLNEGDSLHDFVGPLGRPSEITGENVCVIGGGLGVAIAYPIAKAFHDAGKHVTSIAGFRNKDLVILSEEFKAASDEFIAMSDDGTYGRKGLVTLPLEEMLKSGKKFDKVISIGPVIMMKFVTKISKQYGVPECICSMNPIMIDGTGMCGCCRLTVGGKTKFACVDGPDFNAYEVDFDEAMQRGTMYKAFEKKAYDEAKCNLFKAEVK
jgi:ferredoxin--NADP+ reductase